MRPIRNGMPGRWTAASVIFLALFISVHGILPADDAASAAAAGVKTIEVTIPIGLFTVQHTERGDELAVEGFGSLLVPGKPDLPSRIFSVAIPPGAEVVSVSVDPGDETVEPGTWRIPPVNLPRVAGRENPEFYRRDRETYERNYRSVYESDAGYPRAVGEYLGRSGFRKYDLVDIRVTPFRYRPGSGRLTRFTEVTVRVRCLPAEQASGRAAMDDYLPRKEAIARDIMVNYDEAQAWYGHPAGPARQGAGEFVIITLESLRSAVTPLTDWEIFKGRTVQVVTTDWIDSNYAGYDLAEKIRNMLMEKYPSAEWGVEDVLLVGDYHDVPMRECWQNIGYGRPETDFYYAELSLPDSQSWDADGDRRWGETYGDPIDFYAEINVGRIPWSDYDIVERVCSKSVAYEQNNDPAFKQNILLLGAYFWEDTDCAVLMEYKVDPVLHPWMADWTTTRMYEQNADFWSDYDCDYPLLHSNVMDVWPEGKYAFVNWAGHGSPTSCHIYGLYAPAFINASDSYSMNDDYPAIIFADACSNSDTQYDNIGQMMMRQGAVGFLGSTQVAYGMPAWNDPGDGSTQSLDYYFTTAVTSGDQTQGEAHQWALRQMYTLGLWYDLHYETFEWGALWGSPGLGMGMDESLIVIDNSGSEFFILDGTWNTGEHPNANYGDTHFVRESTGVRRAGWRSNHLVTSGTYEVYVWKFEHEWMSQMATNAPHKVYHKNGETGWIPVDQSTPGNEWVYLGTFEFDDSSTQGVMITDDADGAVIADAVKLVRSSP